MAGRRKLKKRIGCLFSVIAIVAAVVGYFVGGGTLGGVLGGNEAPAPVEGEAEFHFIDVGQGDAALIRTSEGHVLIDAGTNASEDDLKAYLDAEGITKLIYAIFTHPHEDHIGGADMVMSNYEVENVILPDKTATSQTYTRMMDAIEKSGANVIISEPEATYSVGNLKLTILAPLGSGYTDMNNNSVVVRADFGASSVLFTGDAEDVSEEEMLNRYALSGKLDCDLLKVGHHGSESSSTQSFLNAVTPEMAVISCGKDNDYGHPTRAVLDRLEGMNVTYWRTDLEGSVVIISNGETLTKE